MELLIVLLIGDSTIDATDPFDEMPPYDDDDGDNDDGDNDDDDDDDDDDGDGNDVIPCGWLRKTIVTNQM